MRLPLRDILFRLALAAWLLATTTAGSLQHAHEDGDAPHSHGFGFSSLRSVDCPGSGQSPGRMHRHIVLLGFEVFEAPDSDNPLPSDDQGWMFGLPVALKSDAGSAPAQPATVVHFLPVDSSLSLPGSMPVTTVSLALERSLSVPLCVLASGERSGVHRI
jgi:hypothetical protein